MAVTQPGTVLSDLLLSAHSILTTALRARSHFTETETETLRDGETWPGSQPVCGSPVPPVLSATNLCLLSGNAYSVRGARLYLGAGGPDPDPVVPCLLGQNQSIKQVPGARTWMR